MKFRYAAPSHSTYLYYNPTHENMWVKVEKGHGAGDGGPCDLYDAYTGNALVLGVNCTTDTGVDQERSLRVAAVKLRPNEAKVVVITTAGAVRTVDSRGRVLLDGRAIAFRPPVKARL